MADALHPIPTNPSIADLRREYAARILTEDGTDDDPIRQFSGWFDEALRAQVPDLNAMTLATADAAGRPSARIVLLKGFDRRGFVFYTNYHSRKGRDLAANPVAALVFYWHELERQVRIEGPVATVDAEESDAYFASRPAGSRIGAWASDQSRVAANREVIDERRRSLEQRFGEGPIPRPPYWGGYRLDPDVIEFWQGRPDRLHDRLVFRRGDDGRWIRERLFP